MEAQPRSSTPTPSVGSPGSFAAGEISLRTRIQSALDTYPPSMRRIADLILIEPSAIRDKTITELARLCATSEATVVRFCRTLGLTGYAQLRLRMTSDLATEAAHAEGDPTYGEDIGPADSLAATVAKIAHSEVVAIQETASSVDLAALTRLVAAADGANRIILFGVGASGTAAHDLAQKLVRIGRAAFCFPDAHDALAAASLLRPGDVAIAFSHSGRTREPIEFLEAGRWEGAVTAAVVNAASAPLAARADIVLRTAVRETTFRSGAMASRIAQLTVVDYIFVGVAKIRYDETVRALASTHRSVQRLRPPNRSRKG